jgi:hypothetical protein
MKRFTTLAAVAIGLMALTGANAAPAFDTIQDPKKIQTVQDPNEIKGQANGRYFTYDSRYFDRDGRYIERDGNRYDRDGRGYDRHGWRNAGDVRRLSFLIRRDAWVMLEEVRRVHFRDSRTRKEIVDRFEDVFDKSEDFYEEIVEDGRHPYEARREYFELVEEYNEMMRVVNRVHAGHAYHQAKTRLSDSMALLAREYDRRGGHRPDWGSFSSLTHETYLAAERAYNQARSERRPGFGSHQREYERALDRLDFVRDRALSLWKEARHGRPDGPQVEREFNRLVVEYDRAQGYIRVLNSHARRDFDVVGRHIEQMRSMVPALCR